MTKKKNKMKAMNDERQEQEDKKQFRIIRKTKYKLSDRSPYRWFIGALLPLGPCSRAAAVICARNGRELRKVNLSASSAMII